MIEPQQLKLTPSFRPQGYYTNFKQWPIYPNSSNQYWSPNDVVRFYNTIDSGVMDPYKSSINFTVQTAVQNQPVGQLQVDKMATAFFSQLLVISKNAQVQRIAQYDTLCAMLADLGSSQVIAQGRSFQGLGWNSSCTNLNFQPSTSNAGQVSYQVLNPPNTWIPIVQTTPQNTIMPTRCNNFGIKGPFQSITNTILDGIGNANVVNLAGLTSANCTNLNPLWCGQSSYFFNNLVSLQQGQGRFHNMRQQYLSAIQNSSYPDSTSSTVQADPIILNQTWSTTTMLNNSPTSGYNPKAPYTCSFPSTVTYQGIAGNVTMPTTPNIMGFSKPWSAQTSKSGNQATISATVPSCQINQGVITQNKFPVSTKRFNVPLFSATVGALIPPDQFLLIQMKALKDLLLQLTLSPFAMFTSGYCDVHQFDQVGMGIQQKRFWTITQIQWSIHLYTFPDQQLNARINASLVKGIPVTTQFYFLGNTFQLPNGSVVRNNWPISCQSQSLSQIYCIFLSNQYQSKTFCRKQFRLSNNIQSMQIRLKTQFFPTQPIIGNAGNPQWYNNQPDNSNFLKQLYWSNNYMFNMNVPMPKINKINFAINGRCYNTNNTSTFYDPNMYSNQNNTYTWTTNSVNLDTALGMPSFHQNRYIGMAIYAWTWDPYGHSHEFMTGINTAGNQNFAVEFTTSPKNPFPFDETLIIFCRSNGLIMYTNQGIKVIGK